MKHISILNCSVEEVWNAIESSLLYDIEMATSQKVEPKDFDVGFTYQKKMRASRGGMITADVVIKEFDMNKKYTAQFTTNEGINIVSYSLERMNDTECKLTYIEEYKANKKLNSWNAELVSVFLVFNYKKRIRKMMESIENYVVSQR